MDQIKNPFSPGAGATPPALVGRQMLLDKANILFERLREGRSEKNFFLVGLSGVGKTVLLTEIDKHARDRHYPSIFVEAHENKSLPQLLIPPLRHLLYRLDAGERVNTRVKKAFRVLKSFMNGIKFKFQDIEVSLDIDPEKGAADSGDLEFDLPALLEAIGEISLDLKTVMVIIIDELQYLSIHEMSALIMSIHRITQRQLPLALVGAGLPQLVGLTGRSKSYAERLFDFPRVGALSKQDTLTALKEPVLKQQIDFNNDALVEIFFTNARISLFFCKNGGTKHGTWLKNRLLIFKPLNWPHKNRLNVLMKVFFVYVLND